MKGIKVPYVILVLVLLCESYCKETLSFVIHMASVGAKYPEKVKGDWFTLPGAITPVGMRQLYLLGRQLRQRYVEEHHLLNEQYNQQQLTFRAPYSTNKAPCTAAYAFASGLYMPGTGYSLSQFQIKRAVPPTNFTDYKEYQNELRDAALLHYFASVPIMSLTEVPNYPLEAADYCPNIKNIVDNYRDNDAKYKSIISDREKVYQSKLYPAMRRVLSNENIIHSLDEAMNYRDYILSARHFAHPLNGDLSDQEYFLLSQLYETKQYLEYLGDVKVAQLISNGALLEINDTLQNIGVPDPDVPSKVMISYIVPDLNILAMLKLLEFNGVQEKPVTVPYASSLQMEIYNTENNEYIVKILYNNETIPWKHQAPTASLEEFKKWINANLLADFKGDCVGSTSDEVSSSWITISLIIGAVVLVIVGIVFFLLLRDRKAAAAKMENADTEAPTTTV